MSDFNPTLPGHPDPYPLYHRLRAEDPVHWNSVMNGWVLSRYDDVRDFLKDPRFGRGAYLQSLREQFGDSPAIRMLASDLGFVDPPGHTRLRSLVNKAFTPRRVDSMRPQIQAAVDHLLDDMPAAGEMDVIAAIGYPLPVLVICQMLGMPAEDNHKFIEWSPGLIGLRGLVRTTEIIKSADLSALAFSEYVLTLAAKRRTTRGDDLLSALVAVEEQGDKLSEDEMWAAVVSLFGAGHETTKNLIGNALLALLRNPVELNELRENPELINSAIEEALRYDSPTQAPPARAALEDVRIGDKTVRKDEVVTALLGAANRDPGHFSNPDRFDIKREDNDHLAFSFGTRFCLGAPLARAEAQIAIGTIVRRMPNLKLASNRLEWQKADRFRGLKALPVVF